MASPFNAMAGSLTETIFSSIIWVTITLVIIVAVGTLFYYFGFYARKFNIKVKIISERAEEKNKVYYDKAAIITDRKTKVRFIRLWNDKIELPLVSFRVLQSVDGKDLIELYRTSDDKFYFLSPPRIDRSYVLDEDGKKIPIADVSQDIINTDVNFWNVKRKQDNKGMFDTENIIMKLLPYVPQIMGLVFTFFTLYILMDHLPEILSQLSALARELNSYKAAEVITYG